MGNSWELFSCLISFSKKHNPEGSTRKAGRGERCGAVHTLLKSIKLNKHLRVYSQNYFFNSCFEVSRVKNKTKTKNKQTKKKTAREIREHCVSRSLLARDNSPATRYVRVYKLWARQEAGVFRGIVCQKPAFWTKGNKLFKCLPQTSTKQTARACFLCEWIPQDRSHLVTAYARAHTIPTLAPCTHTTTAYTTPVSPQTMWEESWVKRN